MKMSFKREGNDTSLLNTLRNRRIKELLCEEIPEDEAKLLSNGRFACLVCQHNPIFDTVSMLSLHRKGKKHLFNNEIYLKKKKELKHLIALRRHEQYLKDGTTSIKMAQSSSNSILTSKPYDPRVKKSKTKEEEPHEIQKLEAKSLTTSSTKLSDLPGYSHWSETCSQQLSGPVSHSHRLKDIFSDKGQVDVRYDPYKSKYRCTPAQNTMTFYQDSSNKLPLDGLVVTDCKSLLKNKNDAIVANQTSSPAQIIFSTTKRLPVTKRTSKSHVDSLPTHTDLSTNNICPKPENTSRSCSQTSVNKSRQLPGLGWKRDWDGKWIKDETAEFDSDEEPPDIPLML